MLLANRKNSTPLSKDSLTISQSVSEVCELLYDVMNHSYLHSGNCLSVNINGKNFDIQSLWWDCKDKLSQLEKGGEKVDFLTISILEDTFNKVLPLLLVSVQDIADGNMEQPTKVNELRKIFAENEFSLSWKERAAGYKAIIESLGLNLEYSDYEDLTAIMEPLLNAFTFYEGGRYTAPPKIRQIRKGKPSKFGHPKVMTTVCKYASAKEYVDALENCEHDAIISFGAIEQTNGQISDDFYKYLRGYPEERCRNYMKNDNLTEEEYKASPCLHSRVVYAGIKSGENIWLVTCPYARDYNYYESSQDRYYYGKRAGYAPYEVFFNDLPVMPEGTTMLATKKKGYRLDDIMDDMQKIWLPAFIEETKSKFFDECAVEAEEVILPEEIVATAGTHQIVPLFRYLSTKHEHIFNIPTPDAVFKTDPLMLELIALCKVSVESVKDAPFIRNSILNKEAVREYLENEAKSAYIKVLAEKISNILTAKWNTRSYIVDFIRDHREEILNRAKEGKLDSLIEVHIDGEKIKNAQGSPCDKETNNHGRLIEQEDNHTTANDGKVHTHSYLKETMHNYVIWVGEKTATLKPGVVLRIRPTTKDEYALILGRNICEEDTILKYAEHFTHFHELYSSYGYFGNHTTSFHSMRKAYDDKKSCFLPGLADINICMKKNEYKKWMNARKSI